MEGFSITVPAWMDILSFPVLMTILLVLDYCTAVWLQPTNIPGHIRGNAWVKEIFKLLVSFSLIGLAIGFFTAFIELTTLKAFLLGCALLVVFAWAFLTKKLWLVAGICYETAFVIGQVLVNYSALYAFLMTIAMVVTILVMAITIGPLSLMKTK